MGTIADSIIAHGGKSIGIIPRFLKDKEVAHHGLSELIITEDMASRKLKMISLADALLLFLVVLVPTKSFSRSCHWHNCVSTPSRLVFLMLMGF